jgi:hypothetical protein
MAKKGILFLLIIGLFVFVGCDGEIDSNIDWTTIIDTEWGKDTETEPHVSFLGSESDGTLEMMDFVLSDDPNNRVAYTILVTSYSGNTIIGTYNEEMEEDDPYAIRIELSYSSPKLTLVITGEGPLASKTYTLEPFTVETEEIG